MRRGDIVLFSAPDRYGFGELVTERVVGVGGDHVTCCTGTGADTRVSVNGQPLKEPYGKDPEASRGPAAQPYDVRVPEGRLFLLKDHRAAARDARAFLDGQDGTLPRSVIRGRVIEDSTVPVLLGTAMELGALLVPTGVGPGIAALAVRRRAKAAMAPPPPAVARAGLSSPPAPAVQVRAPSPVLTVQVWVCGRGEVRACGRGQVVRKAVG
ncbi:signal peptidase I, partial [Streptomyces sp. NPDC058766]|uniref:signal peptidase I n=1 Tax=Streptomyces sp. NPDC058766 TaxID=3346630 RepID=UPI00369A59DC